MKGAIQCDSFFCDAYYALINTFRSTKEYDSAMKYVDLALQINKVDLWAMKIKGMLYLNKKEYHRASAYFYNLVNMQPREATWLYYYAQSLIKSNKLDSALSITLQMEQMMQQQEGWDSRAISFYLQGQIAFQKEDYQKAFRGFDAIKSTYKRNSEYCYYYGLTFMRKENPDMKKAKRFVKRAFKLGYDEVDAGVKEELGI